MGSHLSSYPVTCFEYIDAGAWMPAKRDDRRQAAFSWFQGNRHWPHHFAWSDYHVWTHFKKHKTEGFSLDRLLVTNSSPLSMQSISIKFRQMMGNCWLPLSANADFPWTKISSPLGTPKGFGLLGIQSLDWALLQSDSKAMIIRSQTIWSSAHRGRDPARRLSSHLWQRRLDGMLGWHASSLHCASESRPLTGA